MNFWLPGDRVHLSVSSVISVITEYTAHISLLSRCYEPRIVWRYIDREKPQNFWKCETLRYKLDARPRLARSAASQKQAQKLGAQAEACLRGQACVTGGGSGGGAFEVEDDHGDVVGLGGAAGEVAHAGAHCFGELFGG